MDNLSMSLMLKNIVFEKEYLKLTDRKEWEYQISYRELVFVYIESYNTESGEEGSVTKPALEDITEETDGELVILDCGHCCWKLQTALSGKTAGAILRELGIRAPYLLLGRQAWMDENEEDDFEQARKMVQIMRECETAI